LAFVPLMTLFFAWAHGLETLRWRGLMGALIATAGILVGVVRGFGSTVHVPSLLALVAGTACLAEASVIFKLFPQSHPVATNVLALTTGTSPLIVLSLLAGEEWSLPTTPNTWASFAYLVLIGSVVVFYLYLHVLARWTASATSYSFLLILLLSIAWPRDWGSVGGLKEPRTSCWVLYLPKSVVDSIMSTVMGKCRNGQTSVI
jgi:drug/metabolite transporter (DMT)-like permease